MNYHWEKARRKAERLLHVLLNDQEFILVTSAGVLAYAQLLNYLRASQEMVKFVRGNYASGDTPYHQDVAKKCDDLLKELADLEEFTRQENVVPDDTEAPAPVSESNSEPEASGKPEGEAQA